MQGKTKNPLSGSTIISPHRDRLGCWLVEVFLEAGEDGANLFRLAEVG
jgi:hypothetical protein